MHNHNTYFQFLTMPEYKLTYFDVRAKGETARLLFALKGQEYTDVRIQQSEWPALKSGKPLRRPISKYSIREVPSNTNKFIFRFISVMIYSHTRRFI